MHTFKIDTYTYMHIFHLLIYPILMRTDKLINDWPLVNEPLANWYFC